MSYIENIYTCLAAPVVITMLCIHRRERKLLLFFIAGMTMCLLSSYISTFLAMVYGADMLTASIAITPMVEEMMKMLPVLFFLVVFEPGKTDVASGVLMVAVGFATFENVCYLTQNGGGNLVFLMIRGFGTGAMHVTCGAIIHVGLMNLWDKIWLRVAGTIGLRVTVILYHGIYNILVSQTGPAAVFGYVLPLFTVLIRSVLGKKLFPKEDPF